MNICKSRGSHVFDETDRCFECDKPMTKAAMMRRLRQERSAKGLVRIELWLTQEQKERVLKYVTRFKRDV